MKISSKRSLIKIIFDDALFMKKDNHENDDEFSIFWSSD
jgi:hypothetical protein